MRSRNNGGIIGAYAAPTVNNANGVFFIHDAAIYNTGYNPKWPLASGFIYSATGGVVSTASDNSNWKVHTFTSNGTFTILDGAGPLEIFIVGGGGGGGATYNATGVANNAYGGGGGGGGIVLANTWSGAGVTFTVTVGGGADTNSLPVTRIFDGGPSVVTSTAGHSYTALGGGGGGIGSANPNNYPGNPGGSAGGMGGFNKSPFGNTSIVLGGQSTSSSGGFGGSSGNGYNYLANTGGGGGGGAGSDGHPSLDMANWFASSMGGDGFLWPRTNTYYAAGGAGARIQSANTTYSSTYVGGGLQGPYPGSHGNSSQISAYLTGVYNGLMPSGNYGSGGGGSGQYFSASTSITGRGGNGAPGCVIFCYRYK